MRKLEQIPNVYQDGKKLFTRSIDKNSFFGETVMMRDGHSHREWDANRSKLAAGLMKGAPATGIKEGNVILYLGGSHGYTTSFLSDVIGKSGFIFSVEIAPGVARELVSISEQRNNIVPVLADANHPEEYQELVPKKFDFVFQDIAQKNQVEIFVKNCNEFLKEDSFAMLAIKARSIDVTKKPHEVYEEVKQQLKKAKFSIVGWKTLHPYEKDHALFIVKR